ncbi:MAG: hypothetical protein FVQ82_12895 [Planctomycetes bacterium]|nr:hypothetical protein [Planctomycetota bacterium]
MAKSAKALIIIEARQRIMRSLEIVYPSGLRMKSLFLTVYTVDAMYDFSLFKKDIAYLAAKRYIQFVDDAIGGMSDIEQKVVKLTAEGLEIAQDTIDDPALEI